MKEKQLRNLHKFVTHMLDMPEERLIKRDMWFDDEFRKNYNKGVYFPFSAVLILFPNDFFMHSELNCIADKEESNLGWSVLSGDFFGVDLLEIEFNDNIWEDNNFYKFKKNLRKWYAKVPLKYKVENM